MSPSPNGKKVKLQATLAPDLWEWLDDEAYRLDITISDVTARLIIAEMALRERCARNEPGAK